MRNVVVIPAFNEAKQLSSVIESVYSQPVLPDAVVVVDNASTDATPDIVRGMQRTEATLHLVSEAEKGTGIACNTGFQYAIGELAASIVSRTDADTTVRPGWTAAINAAFDRNSDTQLASGPSFARHDEFYRRRDAVLWPMMRRAHMVTMAVASREPAIARLAIGHNSATRAAAFEAVGGFPNTDIGHADEDIEYTRKIAAMYGDEAVVYDQSIQVDTSMRRVRSVGYVGLGRYYGNPAEPQSPELRLALTNGVIDIR